MKITTDTREVALAYAKWDMRGLLAVITIDEANTFRAVNVRIDRNGTTENEALGLVQGVARMLAGALVLDGDDLRAIADGVQLLRGETAGDTTTDTYRVRGAA